MPEGSDSEKKAVVGAPVGELSRQPSTLGKKDLGEKKEKVPKPITLQGEATFIKV